MCVRVEKGYKMNIFGLISRSNQCHFELTEQNIDSHFVVEMLDKLSLDIKKDTFVALDNASMHTAKLLKDKMTLWQERGLYIFYLPTYSPQLNLAETMWRMLKTKWITPEDYLTKEALFEAVKCCMSQIGTNLTINFSPFNAN